MPGALASSGAQQRGHQRVAEEAEQVTVGLGEVAAGTIERDADDLRIWAWHAEGDLVLDGNMPEELGVQAEAVEASSAEEVADLDWLAVTGGPVVVDQRVFVYVRGEDRQAGRWDGAGWIAGGAHVNGCGADLVVCQGVAADQLGQAGERKLGEARGVVKLSKAVNQPQGPLRGVQRYVHWPSPRVRHARSVRNMRIYTFLPRRFSRNQRSLQLRRSGRPTTLTDAGNGGRNGELGLAELPADRRP